VAILVIGHARGWWRWLFLIPAIVMPAAVAISRMYRGEHHPTDILGSLLFSALWLTAAYLLIRPNSDGRARSAPAIHGGRPRIRGAQDGRRNISPPARVPPGRTSSGR